MAYPTAQEASPTATSTAVPVPTVTPEPRPDPTATATPKSEPTPEQKESRALFSMSRDVAEGQVAPDFELTTFDGDTFRLSDRRGKVVVLNFWASWCPPCRWEMPHFEEIWQEYRERDVIFIGVAISDFEDKAKAFSDETGVTYPIGLDRTGEIARTYKPLRMPTTLFIDPEGLVARRLVSVANKAELRVFLECQLKDG